MARIQKIPTAPFSPYYGCVIMVMAVLTFAGIIAWSAYSLLTQDKEIAKLTMEEPVKLAPVELSPEARAALEKRLADFSLQVAASTEATPAELNLTVADLNAIITIAPDTGYGTYADMVRVTGTDPARKALITQVCLPMKKLKFWEGKFRYLIAELAFFVHVHEEGVDAKVMDVKVPGKEVPEGFIVGMEIWPWVAPYRKLEPMGSVLKKIRRATVTPEGVTLSTKA